MEDIEKILPILLVAAFYIFSAVQNAKKKKGSDVVKTTLPEGIPKPYSQTIHSLPKEQRLHSPAKSTLQPEVIYNPEVPRMVSSEVLPNRILEEEELVAAFEMNAEDTYELRRAIIYSEILKRKY